MPNIYISIGSRQAGPYSEAELRAMYAAGTISRDTPYRQDGMSEWQPLEHFLAQANKARVLSPVTPPPRRSPPKEQASDPKPDPLVSGRYRFGQKMSPLMKFTIVCAGLVVAILGAVAIMVYENRSGPSVEFHNKDLDDFINPPH